jgi:hypothetical protein
MRLQEKHFSIDVGASFDQMRTVLGECAGTVPAIVAQANIRSITNLKILAHLEVKVPWSVYILL